MMNSDFVVLNHEIMKNIVNDACRNYLVVIWQYGDEILSYQIFALFDVRVFVHFLILVHPFEEALSLLEHIECSVSDECQPSSVSGVSEVSVGSIFLGTLQHF